MKATYRSIYLEVSVFLLASIYVRTAGLAQFILFPLPADVLVSDFIFRTFICYDVFIVAEKLNCLRYPARLALTEILFFVIVFIRITKKIIRKNATQTKKEFFYIKNFFEIIFNV